MAQRNYLKEMIANRLGLVSKADVETRIESTKADVVNQIEQAVKTAMLENYPRWLQDTAAAEHFNMPNPATFGAQADLFRKLSWVLQAVDITAAAAALSRFDVKRVVGDKEPKDIPNHPFELLLRNPNPLDSRFEFLYGTVAMWMLTGNGYWWLNRPDTNTAPSELWLIPSQMIIPVPDERMYIQGYLYNPGNGREVLLPPHEIVHFRRFNPFSRFIGLSAIESIAMTAMGDLGMQQWNTRLFSENNGRLPSILTFEQMVADPTWNKIKDDTREASRNREMLMLRGVGAGGINWMQNSVTQKEMEFLQGREFNRDEIWNTLAPGLVSMLSASATEANARNGSAVFNERTVYPKHVLMAEKITNEILPSYAKSSPSPERNLLGEFEDIRITDKELELREQERFAETHTVDEIRMEYYGDDPIGDERGELFIVQINAQSGGIQEPPPAPVIKPPAGTEAAPPQDGAQQEASDALNKPPADKPDESKKAVLDELAKWERKAVKRVGKAVEFVTGTIPLDVISRIEMALPECKTETAVKMLFESVRAGMKTPALIPQTTTHSGADLRYLADSLNALAAKYSAPTQSAPNIYLQQPSQTFNLPALDPSFTVNMPGQDAPQTYVNITPTIEAAKAPDVRVDSPVTIHQTVEPAPAPQITTPININQTIEPGATPQVTFSPVIEPTAVTNEINFSPNIQPAESAIQVNVEPTPIKFDPTIAAPNVTVNNEIKTPKMKRSKDKVERDGDGNISGKSTDYEYEE